MEHNETGCEAPDRPILCINNCGFFGRAATRNMCSKCHKEAVLKEQQADIAASSIKNIVKGSSTKTKDTLLHATASAINIKPESSETKAANAQVSTDPTSVQPPEAKKGGPSRCTACNKRVGLTGFECKCGNMFCAAHRSSDKHDCPFDYRAAAQSSIAKANPIIKPVKLHKI